MGVIGGGVGPGVVWIQFWPVGVIVFVGSGVEKLKALLFIAQISPLSPGFKPVSDIKSPEQPVYVKSVVTPISYFKTTQGAGVGVGSISVSISISCSKFV